MTFEANRDIKIEASQAADGSYSLRTKGLAPRKRPELEIVGVPEALLRAAGVVLNQVADYTVNRAEVLAGQNVGFELSLEGDDVPMMLAVRAEPSVTPSSNGFFKALIGGGNKGVLRLVDVDAKANTDAPPLTALATMQVHRAKIRLAKDDAAGAKEDLQAAIRAFPGVPERDVGSPVNVGDGESVYNWQNHRAWLALAELEDSAQSFGDALQRSHALALAELGGTLERIATTDAETARAMAERVVTENLAQNVGPIPAPTPAMTVVLSPLWEASADGSQTFRRAALVPAGFRELYFEGAVAQSLREHGARLAADAFTTAREAPWTIAWRFRPLRMMWLDRNAPTLPIGEPGPAAGLLSTLLVAVARAFRAGASADEAAAYLAGRPTPALEKELLALDAWEIEQYERAMFGAGAES